MASKSNFKLSQLHSLTSPVVDEDDDDFQIPTLSLSSQRKSTERSNNSTDRRAPKKPRRSAKIGKENTCTASSSSQKAKPVKSPENGSHLDDFDTQSCSLDCILSSIDCSLDVELRLEEDVEKCDEKKEEVFKVNERYLCNSVEGRLLGPRVVPALDAGISDDGWKEDNDFHVESTELDRLLSLCSELENREDDFGEEGLVQCPLCGVDISGLCEEDRHVHTNDCLDNSEHDAQTLVASPRDDKRSAILEEVVINPVQSPQRDIDTSSVLQWLRSLGLSRYEDAFIREEIDWDTLQWLTEEDLFSMGITALGPRKKIVHALSEFRKGCPQAVEMHAKVGPRSRGVAATEAQTAYIRVDEASKLAATKLITDYFPAPVSATREVCSAREQPGTRKNHAELSGKHVVKKTVRNAKLKETPTWCCIPGTPFRVDAFKYLRGDCSHWFLTHFHMDHYQGLTKSFCHGKIYCSLITAKLVNTKIGIPWDKLQVLPLNQKTTIAGIDVTCVDANHCPGSVLILFEPPSGKAVLHTGDFRYCEEMAKYLHTHPIHTLILDTTYCDPQYDFPKQEAVIQFVIEAIQAETFNPKTLFLIGSYTIGKERLFLEVARVLRRKVYVNPSKLRILDCLGFSKEDMQWFTVNEQESHIHVVPMWTLASFKRLKHIANQYKRRFSLIVAFSPTGWTFGKGKKKTPGRRWQQGTIIRYEVPYSEHSSFTELKEFVKLTSPQIIIPSVNNDGPDSANSMLSLLSQP